MSQNTKQEPFPLEQSRCSIVKASLQEEITNTPRSGAQENKITKLCSRSNTLTLKEWLQEWWLKCQRNKSRGLSTTKSSTVSSKRFLLGGIIKIFKRMLLNLENYCQSKFQRAFIGEANLKKMMLERSLRGRITLVHLLETLNLTYGKVQTIKSIQMDMDMLVSKQKKARKNALIPIGDKINS